jgi:hypothetical protein
MVQPPWAAVRQQCVLTLLQARRFAGWPEMIDVVDKHITTIEDQTERERFVFVAQAILMLRLREDGEGRAPVRAELKAEGVKIGVSGGELCRIIADVQRVFRAPRTREHSDEEVPPGIDAGTMGAFIADEPA